MTETPVLTDSERTALRLLGRGISTEELAAEMGVKPRTAKWYSDSLRAKFGVRHKRELIAISQKMFA